jgi:tetratricopeptide (TPR) repeat protein
VSKRLPRSALLLAITLAGSLGGVAVAESPEQTARTHYEAAHALYRVGNYEQAAREFEAAYAITPRPQLLINAGLAHAKNHDQVHARRCYQRFLDVAPPADPERASVQRLLADLPPDPPPEAASTPTSTTSPSTSAAALTATPPQKSFARRHWWIFPVVGVVVAGGLATGLYFALRPRCSAGLGCVDYP